MQPLSIKIPFPVMGTRSKLALYDCGCTFCSKACVVVFGGGALGESMDLLLLFALKDSIVVVWIPICSSLNMQPLTVDLDSVESLKPPLPYFLFKKFTF